MDIQANERSVKDMSDWLDRKYGADGWRWRVRDMARGKGSRGETLLVRVDIAAASNFSIARPVQNEAVVIDGDVEEARDKAFEECMPIFARRWERFSATQRDSFAPWKRASLSDRIRHLIAGSFMAIPLLLAGLAFAFSGMGWIWLGCVFIVLFIAFVFIMALSLLVIDYVL